MIMDKNMILAKKYGRAIYELACEQNCIEQTEEELSLIISAIKEDRRASCRERVCLYV